MNAAIQMHNVVALLDDVPASHFDTGQPLRLRRGQIGTVVMSYDGAAFEVEFVDYDGHTIALLTLERAQVRPLQSHDIPHARELAHA